MQRVAILIAGTVGLVALWSITFASSSLPAPAPYEGPLPAASPPAEMAVAQIPTGVTHRSAAFAYGGGSIFDERDFTITAVLVKHPRGDLLVDTGLGRRVDAHMRAMPLYFRIWTRYTRGRPAAEQLVSVGYDVTRLRAIVLTHAHWDHVSGAADFPHTPVWVTVEEARHIGEGGALTGVARSALGARNETYGFEDGPYLGFEASRDVYGDGAIVVVPAPGHTPGSVIVFLALPGGERYALIGDLVWQREGITERRERPWPHRTLADSDRQAVRDAMLRMAAIAARWPELTIVPAHDARAFATMPRL
jgi:N-acyl homoserine lactone hydrolase